MRIVLASDNQGKLNEFQQLLSAYDIDVCPQADFAVQASEETGLTFIENALIKARHASKVSGLPALADDSGLAIDALGGAPGIYSSRYCLLDNAQHQEQQPTDQNNIDKVLEKMISLPDSQRMARFHCVLVYMTHPEDPTPVVCHGQWQGSISQVQKGSGGFGYDPIFWVSECRCTAAELTKEQKNARSHRGNALKLLLSQIDLIKQTAS